MNIKSQMKFLTFIIVSVFALGAVAVSTDTAYADDPETGTIEGFITDFQTGIDALNTNYEGIVVTLKIDDDGKVNIAVEFADTVDPLDVFNAASGLVNALTEIVSLDSTLNIDENGPFKLNDDKLLSALVVVLLGEIESPEAFLQNGETVTAGYTAKVFYKNAEIDFGGGLSFTAIGTMETLIDALKTEIDALNTGYEGIVVTLKIDDDGKVNIAVEFADTVDPLDVFNAASGLVNALTEIVSLDSTLNIDENGPFKLNDDKLLSALVVVLLGEIESPEAFLQNGETVTAGYTAKVFYKNAEIDFGGGLSFTAIGTMETLIDALKTEIDALNTNYEGIVVTLKIDDDGKVNIAVEFADTVDPLDVFNAASGLVNALTEIVSLDSTLNIDENGPFKLNDDKLLSALVVVLLGEIESPEAFLQNGETVTAGYTAKVFYKNAEIDFGGGLSFTAIGTMETLIDALKTEIDALNTNYEGIVVTLKIDDDGKVNIAVEFADTVDPLDVFNAASGLVNALTEIVSLDSTLNIDENGPFKLNDDKLLSALVVVLLGEIESPEAFLQNGETVTAGYTAKVFYKNAEIDFGGGLSFTAIGTMETLIDALKTEIDALNTNYEGIVVTLKIDDDGKVNIAVEFADTVDPLDVFNAASGLVNALTEIVSLDSTLNIDENGPFKLNDDKLLSALVVVLLGEIESPEAFLQNGETVTAGYTAKVFYKNAEIDFGGGLSFKVSSYTITWIVNGQTYIVTTVDSGDKVVLPTDPSEDGYTFKGWFASIEFTVPVTTDTEPTAGTSYFAKMDPIEYTINFGEGITVKKGETPIDTGDQIAYGTVLTVTADPKTGHTSKLSATAGTIDTDGKYTVEGEVTFSVTYTAIKYTITFDTGDGSEIDSISGDYNTPAEAPTDPVLTGYAFMGWTKNLAGEPVVKFVFDEDTVFNEDFTLYAIWEIEEYTITFDTGDGSTVNPIIADYDTEITAPANPTRAGYDFVRWDTAIPVKMPANDLTITAVWKLKVFEEPPTDDDIEDIIETNENPVIRLDDEIDDFVIGNTVFENIGEKVLVIDVVDDDDKVLYSWSFSGDYKADAGTFKPKVSVKEDVEEMTEALKASKIENPLVLDFSASGTLPMEASVKYYVGDKFASGTVISLFFFNEESNELEDQGQEIVVDDDGYAVFTLTHCSYYILGESAESGEGSPNYMPLIGIALASIIVIVVAMFVILNRRN